MGSIRKDEEIIIGIHQPNFLPWLGYFYKITKSDIFVLLDNVQYTKNSFINRNKIKTSQGDHWLTVPVSFKFGDLIKDVTIDNNIDWRKKHLKTFELNYKKAPHFDEIYNFLERVYYKKEWIFLADFNIELIVEICCFLDMNKKFIKASSLNILGKSTDLLINIVKNLNGDIYLSGKGGQQYQDESKFNKENIKLIYSDFKHPVYRQLWGEFIENLSIIDILFNLGKESKIFLTKVDVTRVEDV
ncbi:MAG TPA: WbqC family protein [bacterium]|nr:WbqC family protein [bacterium]